jgi:hypothetical protein
MRCVQRHRPLQLFEEQVRRVTFGSPFIHVWPARRGENSSKTGFPLREVSCPSRTACYSTSSLSVQWWTTQVRSGGRLLATTSRSCKCGNRSFFSHCDWRTLYVSKRQIHEDFGDSNFRRPHRGTDWELRADAGNTSVRPLESRCASQVLTDVTRATEEGWCTINQSRLLWKGG